MSNQATRWESESRFFDRVARGTAGSVRPVSPVVLERYRKSRRRRFAPEYRFRLAGDLQGKRVLDVGCGDGANSVLLARLGARVDGIDISPGAIDIATSRASINDVSDRTTFTCTPLETADLPESRYDVVWCDAILHHLIPELETVIRQFRRWVTPGGMIIMVEPVNLSPALRRLRFAVAADTEHTPDERPLEPAEIAIIKRCLPEAHVRYFRAFARLDRYVLPDMQYESAPKWRKSAYGLIAALDWAILSVAPLQRLASSAVISARIAK